MRTSLLALTVGLATCGAGCRSLCHQYSGDPSPGPGSGRFIAGFVVFSSYGYDQAELTAGPGAALDVSVVVATVGPGVQRRPGDEHGWFRSELAVDLTAARTFHDVRHGGGGADIATVMLGVRYSTPRLLDPRVNFMAGFTFARFEYEDPALPEGQATGVYVGAGLETFLMPNFSVGADYTIHHLRGEDNAGTSISEWYDQGRMYIAMHW